MPLTRLLVNTYDEQFDYKVKFDVSKEAIAELLPEVVATADFSRSANLMEAEFYETVIWRKYGSDMLMYRVFGYCVVVWLFAYYGIRSVLSPHANAAIIPHILALKTTAMMFFPLYPEMYHYCYGFIAADLHFFK